MSSASRGVVGCAVAASTYMLSFGTNSVSCVQALAAVS